MPSVILFHPSLVFLLLLLWNNKQLSLLALVWSCLSPEFGVSPSLNITSILKLFSLYTILLGSTPTFALEISFWGLIETDTPGFSFYLYLPIMSSQTGEFGRRIREINFKLLHLAPHSHSSCLQRGCILVHSQPYAKVPLLPLWWVGVCGGSWLLFICAWEQESTFSCGILKISSLIPDLKLYSLPIPFSNKDIIWASSVWFFSWSRNLVVKICELLIGMLPASSSKYTMRNRLETATET